MSLRQRAGALIHDWPRFLRHIHGDWARIHNRAERITSDGRGVRCDWRFGSDLHIANVHPSTSSWLLKRALADWPIELAGAPATIATAPSVSFIIGHRGMARVPHLMATLRSIAAQKDVAFECVVVEQSHVRELEMLLPPWVRYVHQPVAEGADYCRAATFNAGALAARGELLIVHDNDTLVPARYAAEALARLRDGWHFQDLKRFMFFLEERDTARVFATGELRTDVHSSVWQNQRGGSTVVSAEGLDAVGGFDESFIGWGGEDLEFWERAEAVGGAYPFGYLPFVHLWHAPQKGKLMGDAAPAQMRYEELHRITPGERIAMLRARR